MIVVLQRCDFLFWISTTILLFKIYWVIIWEQTGAQTCFNFQQAETFHLFHCMWGDINQISIPFWQASAQWQDCFNEFDHNLSSYGPRSINWSTRRVGKWAKSLVRRFIPFWMWAEKLNDLNCLIWAEKKVALTKVNFAKSLVCNSSPRLMGKFWTST